jgi:A/G-specific adenine glycosylase
MFDDEAALANEAQRHGAELEVMPRIAHALTHFDWLLHTRRAEIPGRLEEPGKGEWVARERLSDYALPAPLKKLLT